MISVSVKVPDLAARVEAERDNIHKFIAANMQTNRGLLFDSSGARNGHTPWAPLQWRQGQPLKLTGTLARSIGPMSFDTPTVNKGGIVKVTGDIVTIGTKLAYAPLMNYGTTRMPGGVMRPVKARALRFPKPHGEKGYMYRMSVKIPARRFDLWTLEDENEINVATANKIARVLNGR